MCSIMLMFFLRVPKLGGSRAGPRGGTRVHADVYSTSWSAAIISSTVYFNIVRIIGA